MGKGKKFDKYDNNIEFKEEDDFINKKNNKNIEK